MRASWVVRLWSIFVLAVGASSVLAGSQANADQPLHSSVKPAVRTVATVRGGVVGFAQDQRYLAWLLPAGGYGAVVMDDLRSGAQIRLPRHPASASDNYPEGIGGFAIAGNRAYWEQTSRSQTTGDAVLASAATADKRLRALGEEEVDVFFPSDRLEPPVADGPNVYFWSSSEPNFVGPIVRFRGSMRHRVTRAIYAPAALAAGGGRLALATHDYDGAGAPTWSPDGKQIAYNRGAELWLVNADGSDIRQVAQYGLDPDWSPDGSRLAYGGPANTIVVANADGTQPHAITSGSEPAWSPDGRQLAVTDQGGIWLVAADGSNKRLVIETGTQADWSPDGSRLVFQRGEYDGEVDVANVDGSNVRTLLGHDAAQASPAWSPDGNTIALACDCDKYDGNVINVCEIHPDGSGLHCLATGADDVNAYYDAAWAPSGNQLVMVRVRETGDGDAHLVLWPGQRLISNSPTPTPLVIYPGSGHTATRFEPGGLAVAIAVSKHVAAALVHERSGKGWALEIYQPRLRLIQLSGRPNHELAVAGTTLVFEVGKTIERLDAQGGRPLAIATTPVPAIGLSIVGKRVAWAENFRGHSRIRMLTLPGRTR